MPLRAIFAALIVAICWGGNYSATKLALADFPPMLMLLLRFTAVCVILAPFALRMKRPRMREMFIISMTLMVIQFGLLFSALDMGLSVTSVVVATQLGVPFACLMSAIFFKDYLGPWRSFGLMIAFTGVVIVAGSPNAAEHWGAFLLALIGALSWSSANLYLKTIDAPSTVPLLFWPTLFSVPAFLLLSLVTEHGQMAALAGAHWDSWIAVAYSVVLSSLVGYGLWNWLVTTFPVSQVMPYGLLMPIFGIGAGMVMFGEKLSAQIALGGVLTMVGVGIISLRRPKLMRIEQ